MPSQMSVFLSVAMICASFVDGKPTMYAAPMSSTYQTGYSAPAPVYAAPAMTYSAPAPVYSAPMTTYAAPAPMYAQPSYGHDSYDVHDTVRLKNFMQIFSNLFVHPKPLRNS